MSAQVARHRIGNPDPREAVVLQQVPEMPGVAPIGLGFAHDHRCEGAMDAVVPARRGVIPVDLAVRVTG